MRLSTVFELLLIFLLIAFAAYGRVIDRDEVHFRRTARSNQGREKQGNIGVSVISLKQATENVNKYCNCDGSMCHCCREFNIPLVALKGPGCASLQYRENDNLAVQLNFGQTILTSKVISGKKSESICVPMLGGFSKFCGRIYSIERETNDHFKACLGLELQTSSELEASLRVSCFRFGPDGVKLRPAEEFPVVQADIKPDDDDEDDDDDIFSLEDDDDDDDDDDDENEQLPSKNTAALASTNNQQSGEYEDDDDDDDLDILGFGALFDMITGSDDSDKKKTTTVVPLLPFTIPMISKPTTGAPLIPVHHDSVTLPDVKKQSSAAEISDTTTVHSVHLMNSSIVPEKTNVVQSSLTSQLTTINDSSITTQTSFADNSTVSDASTEPTILQSAASNDVKYIVAPGNPLSSKRITVGVLHNKFSGTSSSVNAIKNDVKKTSMRPTKLEHVHTVPQNYEDDDGDDDDDEDEDDDDDDILGTSDANDDDYESELNSIGDVEEHSAEKNKNESVGNSNKKPSSIGDEDQDTEEDETLFDDDEDEDEEEDAVLSALVLDEKDNVDEVKKIANVEPNAKPTETNDDFNVDLTDLLSKKRHIGRHRQSKVMRL